MQASTPGKITATPPSAAGTQPDTTLPDPTHFALAWLAILLGIAAFEAIGLNALHWTARPFTPATGTTANFTLLAGFYVAAQVIERLMQLVAPFLPWWDPPAAMTDPHVKVAQTKADRATVALGIAALLGVGASCGFGLFFLKAVGMHASHTVDSFLTGITIAAGTKPLHDFISLIQNQNTPKTGSGTS